LTAPLFPIDRLRLFSADGQVYRAFDHLIAARMGTLLLVPLHLVTGPFHLPSGKPALVDGCPVPWEEVHAVLKYPATSPIAPADATLAEFNYLQRFAALGLSPAACEMDHIAPMVNGEEKVLRLVHPCGVRYAVAVN
jgi:hypothetical protein